MDDIYTKTSILHGVLAGKSCSAIRLGIEAEYMCMHTIIYRQLHTFFFFKIDGMIHPCVHSSDAP